MSDIMGWGCNDTSNIAVTNTRECWNCLKILLLSFTDRDGDGLWRKSRKALYWSLQTGWRKPSQISGWVAITLQMIDLSFIKSVSLVKYEWRIRCTPSGQLQDKGAEHFMLEDKNGQTVLQGPGLHVPDTWWSWPGTELNLIPHWFYKRLYLG